MAKYFLLKNVIDTRNGQFYSQANVSQRNLKWFIEAEESEAEE